MFEINLRKLHVSCRLLDKCCPVAFNILLFLFPESLRKYPSVYTIARVCTAETILDIDDKTALIDVGTNVCAGQIF